jgi:hypothetical protein
MGEKARPRTRAAPGSSFTTRRASARPSIWLPEANPLHTHSLKIADGYIRGETYNQRMKYKFSGRTGILADDFRPK